MSANSFFSSEAAEINAHLGDGSELFPNANTGIEFVQGLLSRICPQLGDGNDLFPNSQTGRDFVMATHLPGNVLVDPYPC